jgi:hypothetical protein
LAWSITLRRSPLLGPAQRADRDGGNLFKPDGLPDAGGARIPDRVRFQLPILLAARLCQVVGIVLGAHNQCLRTAAAQIIGNIDLERRVAAFMAGEQRAVEPDRRAIIDRAEVQDQPLPGTELRRVEAAAIPARLVKAGVMDAAGRSFRREGHNDLRVPRDLIDLLPSALGIESKIPAAVK